MSRFFFLPSGYFFSLLIFWIYALLNFPFGGQLLVSIIATVILYATRRKQIPFRDTLRTEGEIYLSPVHGEVRSIRRSVSLPGFPQLGIEVRISVGDWSEKGLYLPTTGEVSYLKATKGRRISRYAEAQDFYGPVDEIAHTDFLLTSKNRTQTLLRFIDARYGRRPTIWLKSGDRGRGAACFGYYPFGGTLLVYLPPWSDILVFENEKVVPGQSVLAAIKDQDYARKRTS